MLPLEWMDEARPMRGHLLVRRFEEQEKFGSIWIPPGAVKRLRPPFAEVLKVGKDVDPRWEYEEGDIVALQAIAGVRTMFGNRQESHYIYSVPPTYIICGVREDQVERAKDLGESPFRIPGKDPRESMTVEGRRDHGRIKAAR